MAALWPIKYVTTLMPQFILVYFPYKPIKTAVLLINTLLIIQKALGVFKWLPFKHTWLKNLMFFSVGDCKWDNQKENICNLDGFGSISTIILVCVVCKRPFASVQSLAFLKKKTKQTFFFFYEGSVRGKNCFWILSRNKITQSTFYERRGTLCLFFFHWPTA